MRDLFLFFVIMISLGIVWYSTGGPERGQTDQPFLRPPAPIGSGEQYGPSGAPFGGTFIQKREPAETKEDAAEETTPGEEAAGAEEKTLSLFDGKVSFGFSHRPKESDPQKEYLEIVASRNNTQPISISAWRLKSAITGRGDVVGEGTYLPIAGNVSQNEAIFLRPGERAFIVTGRSPIGVSFKTNKCTGYFAQFQSFAPSLKKECPRPKDELLPREMLIDNQCMDIVENFGRCEAHITGLPPGLDPVCQTWISEHVHYNGCVDIHKGDRDFAKPEWRIYLARSNELWRDRRETILLLDESGKIVDSLSY